MVSPLGVPGQGLPTTACASLAQDQPRYYQCLCQRWTSVVQCFQNLCPSGSIASAISSQTQFCGASQANPATSTSTIVLGPLTKSISAPSATLTNSGYTAALDWTLLSLLAL